MMGYQTWREYCENIPDHAPFFKETCPILCWEACASNKYCSVMGNKNDEKDPDWSICRPIGRFNVGIIYVFVCILIGAEAVIIIIDFILIVTNNCCYCYVEKYMQKNHYSYTWMYALRYLPRTKLRNKMIKAYKRGQMAMGCYPRFQQFGDFHEAVFWYAWIKYGTNSTFFLLLLLYGIYFDMVAPDYIYFVSWHPVLVVFLWWLCNEIAVKMMVISRYPKYDKDNHCLWLLQQKFGYDIADIIWNNYLQ